MPGAWDTYGARYERDRTVRERTLVRALAKVLRGQSEEVRDQLIAGGLNPASVNWDDLRRALSGTLRPEYEGAYVGSIEQFEQIYFNVFDPPDLVRQAAEWAEDMANGMARDIAGTTERNIADGLRRFFREVSDSGAVIDIYQGVSDVQRGLLTVEDLTRILAPSFGPKRAEMIASTEITRAVNASTERLKDEFAAQGVAMVEVWYTAEDSRVCPICGPNHGKRRGDGWEFPPPAHPRCRCATVLELVEDS
jgi:hypothetical protein